MNNAADLPGSTMPILSLALSRATEGYHWTRSSAGQSDATVYRLHGKPGAPDLFLKYGRGAAADALTDETAKLGWLARHLPVAGVEHFARNAGEAVLLTAALDGASAADLLDSNPGMGPQVVDALADFLLRLHAIPAGECPFNSRFELRLVDARRRIAAGLVDTDDFDDERQGWTAEQVWEALQRKVPPDGDAVVTHGDFSLDNLLVKDGKVTGCIDVGRLGVADRYQDIAIAWNCLREHGAALQDRFLARYGLARADHARLEFHLLLDELF